MAYHYLQKRNIFLDNVYFCVDFSQNFIIFYFIYFVFCIFLLLFVTLWKKCNAFLREGFVYFHRLGY